MKEKEIEKSILEYLSYLRLNFWKNDSVGIYDPITKGFRRRPKYTLNGVSDILGILPDGRFCAIEVKTNTGRLSKAQKEFINMINDNNGLAFVARSVKDVMEKINEISKRR